MALASDLGITDVLSVVTDRFGIQGIVQGDEYVFTCLNPEHNDRRPSCSVNLTTGLFNCFSCGFKGDILKLGRYAVGGEIDEIKKSLTDNTHRLVLSKIARKMEEFVSRRINDIPQELPGPYKSGPMDYMYGRGFTDDTLKRWGVRFVKKQKMQKDGKKWILVNNIGIPLKTRNGDLVGWCYRRTDKGIPRYMYTPHIKLDTVWAGIHVVKNTRVPVITEGIMDAMWVDQAGYPAMAMLGSSVKDDTKFQMLKQYEGVTLFFDNDQAGRRATYVVGNKLHRSIPVWVARYPGWVDEEEDPNDLDRADIELAMTTSIPWIEWKRQ